jgi:hypothetical protein
LLTKNLPRGLVAEPVCRLRILFSGESPALEILLLKHLPRGLVAAVSHIRIKLCR